MFRLRSLLLVLIVLASHTLAHARFFYENPALFHEPIKLDLNYCEITLSKRSIFESYLSLLKWKVRRGLTYRGVPVEKAETIWEHIDKLKKAARILGRRRGLDVNKMIFIALVHDIAESIGIDYIPADNKPKAEKQAEELEHMNTIYFNIRVEDPELAERVKEAWEDYEFQRSKEARLVKQLDKIDAAIGASVYERNGLGNHIKEFYETPYKHLKDPKLKALFDKFVSIRFHIDDPYTWYFANLE
ncbi:MAG: HD domain-containing protein [Bdellovibrionales bacterium]|nr:HD domain-containing protein [Bdellovibrionales bacterium]